MLMLLSSFLESRTQVRALKRKKQRASRKFDILSLACARACVRHFPRVSATQVCASARLSVSLSSERAHVRARAFLPVRTTLRLSVLLSPDRVRAWADQVELSCVVTICGDALSCIKSIL